MKKLVDINFELLTYKFNYDESESYNKKALEKYNDYVVAIRETERYYFILLKGNKKFFGYKFGGRFKSVKRCMDMKVFIRAKGRRVLDKKEFGLFKRQLILEELKWK